MGGELIYDAADTHECRPCDHQPILLLDLDGPLADFDSAYYRLCVDMNVGVSPFTFGTDRAGQQHRFMDDDLLPEHADIGIEARNNYVNRPGWFIGLPPTLPDIGNRVNELAESFDVYICTKPLHKNPTCMDEKAAWLEHHIGDGWGKRMISTYDKSIVRGDVLLDDAINDAEAVRASWTPVVYPTPFNHPGSLHGQGWSRWSWGDPIERLANYGGTTLAEGYTG